MSEEFLAYVGGAETPDWSDPTAVIDHIIDLLRLYSGGSGHFDEATMRDLVGQEIDRTVNIASSQINHFAMGVGAPFRDRLKTINVPALVVHGTQDPVFPLGHALALVEEIPDARLLTLEQTGHELPRAAWDVVIPAIVRHTARATRVSLGTRAPHLGETDECDHPKNAGAARSRSTAGQQ